VTDERRRVRNVVTAVVGRFDPLVGHGLAYVLEMDPNVCVLAADLEHTELERSVLQHAPEVVILDETAEAFMLMRLRSVRPATGVIVFAHSPSRAYGMRLLTSGATCLALNTPIADILTAIPFAARGGRLFISPDGERAERQYPPGACLLTPRETEVLAYVSAGRSNPEIACALQIGVETVNTHVARIRHKLKVRSKRDLIGIPVLSHHPNRLMSRTLRGRPETQLVV
jgi:DNA-binding NarL/FixJ family response regulator